MPGAAGPTRSVPPSRRRSRALLPTLVILGALLIGFSIVTGFYTDLLWFRSVGATSVFTRTLGAKALLFVLFGLLFAAVVAVNFVVAYRFRPTYQAMIPGQQELDRYRMAIDPYKRVVVAAIVTLLGLIAGSTAAGEWRMYMQWRNGVSFGQKDAQFGKDISFFAFELPWWRFVLGFAIATVVIGLMAAAVTHYLYGGLRLQAELHKTILFVTHDIAEAIALGDQIVILAKGGVIAQQGTPTEIVSEPADDFVAQFLGLDDTRALRVEGDLVVDHTGRPVGRLS